MADAEDIDTATYLDIEDVQSHLKTALDLNAALSEQNKMLRAELRRLKAKSSGEVNVLVYGKKDALAVAVVTDGDGQGVWRGAVDQFEKHRGALAKKDIVFQAFTGIEINEQHSSPFRLSKPS